MKFEITQYKLSALLSVIGPVIQKNLVNPILENVHVIVDEGGFLHIEGTNLSVSVRTARVETDEFEAGDICIGYATLSKIINSIGRQKQITVEEQENKVLFKSGKLKVNLNKINSDNFPKLIDIDTEDLSVVELDKFYNLFKTVCISTSADDTKTYLMSIYLELTRDKMVGVSTDGHRMSCIEIDTDNKVFVKEDEKKKILIPAHSAEYIGKVLGKSNGELLFGIVSPKNEKDHVVFSGDFGEIVTKLIDSTFPPYEQIIPKIVENKMFVINHDILKTILSRVNILEEGKEPGVIMKISKDNIAFSNINTTKGNIAEIFECEYGDGMNDDVQIAVNSNFFMQWLNVVNSKTENVKIMVESAKQAVMCLPEDNENGYDHKYILMPIKLS